MISMKKGVGGFFLGVVFIVVVVFVHDIFFRQDRLIDACQKLEIGMTNSEANAVLSGFLYNNKYTHAREYGEVTETLNELFQNEGHTYGIQDDGRQITFEQKLTIATIPTEKAECFIYLDDEGVVYQWYTYQDHTWMNAIF